MNDEKIKLKFDIDDCIDKNEVKFQFLKLLMKQSQTFNCNISSLFSICHIIFNDNIEGVHFSDLKAFIIRFDDIWLKTGDYFANPYQCADFIYTYYQIGDLVNNEAIIDFLKNEFMQISLNTLKEQFSNYLADHSY